MASGAHFCTGKKRWTFRAMVHDLAFQCLLPEHVPPLQIEPTSPRRQKSSENPTNANKACLTNKQKIECFCFVFCERHFTFTSEINKLESLAGANAVHCPCQLKMFKNTQIYGLQFRISLKYIMSTLIY